MDKKKISTFSNDLNEELIQLGVRVPHSLRLALKAASLQQELRNKTPKTQAGIVIEALHDWLKSNGYEEVIDK